MDSETVHWMLSTGDQRCWTKMRSFIAARENSSSMAALIETKGDLFTMECTKAGF